MTTTPDQLEGLGNYEYGWSDTDKAGASAQRGLSEAVVRDISARKDEPEWMLEQRLKGLRLFEKKPMPSWGSDLSGIDFDNIKYFVRSTEAQAESWEDLPEDIKNTYDRLGIPEAEKQRLVAGVAAQYECLAGDSRVWTADRGLVPIKEIVPGDQVFALDEDSGQFVVAPVKAAAQTDVRQTYELTAGTRKIRATDNHPLLVLEDARKPGRQRARFRKRWKVLADIQVGDFIAVPRQLPVRGASRVLRSSDGFGPASTNPDLMWLLGFFTGDGNVQSAGRTHRVQFAVYEQDPEVRSEITRIVKEQFGLRTIAADKYRLVVNSKALCEWIQDQGVAGRSLTKRIPDWIHALPVDERLAYLGGYVDADGYVSPEKSGSVMLTSGNSELLLEAAALAVTSGLRASRPYRFESTHPHDPDRKIIGFRITITGEFELLDCRNPRRTDRFGRRSYYHSDRASHGTTIRAQVTEHIGFVKISSIEPYDVEPVFDIEIDGPHNFVAEGLVVHNSEVVYHKIREDLEEQGVIFLDTDTALKEQPELFKEYFGTIIPAGDNKFSALNTAVWSGGSFIYVPKGVQVDIPLQAYFRINTENMGQFERTLIIVDEDAYIHYVEGCTAPIYKSDSLHSAVVEIIVKKGARCRYTTIQNWSTNVYNLVTKRAVAQENATMEWVDGNLGSKVTMKYPAVWLMGEHAKGETLSIAFAGPGQHQDAGSKMVHAAPNTYSSVVSKSVARGGGRTSYRGLVQIQPKAVGSASTVRCDALLVDDISRSDTYPYNDIRTDDVSMGHEATVSKVSEDQLFYLQSRGISEDEAMAMIVRGFIEPIARELPMEYALELNRLIELQMEGAVG